MRAFSRTSSAEPAAARHRLASVDDQVEQDLLDLAGHDRGLRPAVELRLDLDAVLAQVLLGQDQHLLDQADDVGQLRAWVELLRAKPSMLLTMVAARWLPLRIFSRACMRGCSVWSGRMPSLA